MADKQPLVSIIIPVYNEEKQIRFCIESLLKQTYSPIEILIADDGSIDATPKIIRQYPVKFFQRSHLGPAEQSNFLAGKAGGKILVRTDGDMTHDPNYIARLIEPILKGKAVATFNKEVYIANPQNIWAKCWLIYHGIFSNRIIPETYKNSSGVFRAILKKIFLKVGGYDDIGYEDDQTVLKKLGKSAIKAEGAISYCYYPENLTDVFTSSCWIGKGEWFNKHILFGISKYNPFISLFTAIFRSIQYQKPELFIYILIYNYGIFTGIIKRFITGKHNK